MGRRSLPKIDPKISIDEHLFLLESLAAPFDPQSLFLERQPLELEIGSGKGHFLLQHSQKYSERNFLGIEIAKKYARFAAYRLAKHERQNARMISGDGLACFRQLLPDRCAEDVHVYFPDPWWKERHRRRRVMQPPFIEDIERVLVEGGRLHFWTDVEEYFLETIGLIREGSGLIGPNEVPAQTPENPMDYRTHFERRMRLHDQDVFRAVFLKPTKTPIPSLP